MMFICGQTISTHLISLLQILLLVEDRFTDMVQARSDQKTEVAILPLLQKQLFDHLLASLKSVGCDSKQGAYFSIRYSKQLHLRRLYIPPFASNGYVVYLCGYKTKIIGEHQPTDLPANLSELHTFMADQGLTYIGRSPRDRLCLSRTTIMDELVRKQFRAWHCNEDGVQQGVVNFTRFCQRMYALHPSEQHKELKKALGRSVGLSIPSTD